MPDRQEEIMRKLREEGILILSSNACAKMAETVMNLVDFSNNHPTKEITLYISSMVDDYVSMMTIYDVIKSISNPVSCIVMGSISSYATLLAASCTKGKRAALKHATLSIDQPSAYLSVGTNLETDVTISAKEAKQERKEYERILALETGMDEERIHQLAEEDTSLNPQEAIKLGIIDKVI